jgi:hypothetical protein
LQSLLGEDRYPELVAWCRTRSITIRGYQGSGLDGNNCKAFFKASTDLGLLLGEATAAPITDMLNKFDAVTKACFSRKLDKDWEKIIDSFITSVWELISFCRLTLKRELSVTWKLHMLVTHLKRLLGRLGEGLADYSEQTGESGHHKVEVEMSRFHLAEENPRHGERMLAGASRFNGKRV